MGYECSVCKRVFLRKAVMARHTKGCGQSVQVFKCLRCPSVYKRQDNLTRHMNKVNKMNRSLKPEQISNAVNYENEPKFEILQESETRTEKFSMKRKNILFKLKTVTEAYVSNPVLWIQKSVKALIDYIVREIEPDNRIGFTLSAEELPRQTYLPFKMARNVTFEDIWHLISSLYQSNIEGLNTDTFRLTLTKINPPRGRGRKRTYYYNNFEEECRKRSGIITINNTDHLCLPRALVVAIARIEKDKNYKRIRDGKKVQVNRVQQLLSESNIIIPSEGAGIEELQALQLFLTSYKITVYIFGTKGREVLFEGPDAPFKINLLYHKNHYTLYFSYFCCFYVPLLL